MPLEAGLCIYTYDKMSCNEIKLMLRFESYCWEKVIPILMCLYMHQALYQKKKTPKHFDMHRVVKFSRYHFTFHLFCKPTPLSPQTVTFFFHC